MLAGSLLVVILLVGVVLELSSFRVLESVSDEGIGWGRSLSQYWIWWGLLGQRAVDGLATKSYRGECIRLLSPRKSAPIDPDHTVTAASHVR